MEPNKYAKKKKKNKSKTIKKSVDQALPDKNLQINTKKTGTTKSK